MMKSLQDANKQEESVARQERLSGSRVPKYLMNKCIPALGDAFVHDPEQGCTLNFNIIIFSMRRFSSESLDSCPIGEEDVYFQL